MTSLRWADRYALVPFRNGGRDATGWDCWGLVMTVIRDRTGVLVPDYPVSVTDGAGVARAFRDHVDSGDWLTVLPGEARAMDVAVMRGTEMVDGRARRLPFHAGVFLSPDTVMHTEAALGTMVLALSSPEMARRLVYIRRYKGLVR